MNFFRKEGGFQEATGVTVANILENVDTFGDLVGSVWDIMTSNPLLLVFLCGGLIGLGFKMYKKAKNAASSN